MSNPGDSAHAAEVHSGPTATRVRDVEADAATNPAIVPFIRRNCRTVQETAAGQRRLLRKWEVQRDFLRSSPTLDPFNRERLQLERVRVLADTAFMTCGFYRELYQKAGFEPGGIVTWSDFECLPVVTKQMMVEVGFSDQVADAHAHQTLHSARTSGSSGLNLTIYQDNASVDYRHLLYMRHCELILGDVLKPDDWRYGIYFAAERYTSLLGNYPFVTISQECPPDLLLQHLGELRPRLILAFPSYLQRLAVLGVGLAGLGVRAIGTNSEQSSAEERLGYSAAFGVPVLDEYSSEEMSLIAYECRQRRYHLVEDSGYFEVVDTDDEGFGRLVGTSLGNACMPFIRYDQGDLLRVSGASRTCECGSRFRTIEGFQGRADDGLRDGPARRIPSDAILGLCDRTLVEAASNVLQYQIVQTHPDRIVLKVRLIDLRRGSDTPPVAAFTRCLPELFENVSVQVKVEEVDYIATFASGKRRLIHVEQSAMPS